MSPIVPSIQNSVSSYETSAVVFLENEIVKGFKFINMYYL